MIKKLGIIFLSVVTTALVAARAQEKGPVVRLDPALDAIVPPDATVEKLAGGLGFTEGPVWDRKGGYLLFSDIRADAIMKWNPADGKVSVFLERSGSGGRPGTPSTPQSGANGVTMDKQGRIVFCASGDRQIERLEKDGRRTVLADAYEGKRLNRTNDLVMKSNGAVYFTDPAGQNPEGAEMDFNGVFMAKDGKVTLLAKDILSPNGLAFTPDEKRLYINDIRNKTILRYDVQRDGTIVNGKPFINMSSDPAVGGPDGMKVDTKGSVYSTGPGGIWIISPEGKHLGTILTPEVAANLAFGDADGKTLYVTARTGLYRIRGFKIPGVRP